MAFFSFNSLSLNLHSFSLRGAERPPLILTTAHFDRGTLNTPAMQAARSERISLLLGDYKVGCVATDRNLLMLRRVGDGVVASFFGSPSPIEESFPLWRALVTEGVVTEVTGSMCRGDLIVRELKAGTFFNPIDLGLRSACISDAMRCQSRMEILTALFRTGDTCILPRFSGRDSDQSVSDPIERLINFSDVSVLPGCQDLDVVVKREGSTARLKWKEYSWNIDLVINMEFPNNGSFMKASIGSNTTAYRTMTLDDEVAHRILFRFQSEFFRGLRKHLSSVGAFNRNLTDSGFSFARDGAR